MSQKLLSIAWAPNSTVAETLARRLGAEFHLLPCPRRAVPERPSLYRRLRRETLDILRRAGPDVVLVQNPPIHAVSAVAGYAQRSGARFAIDAHSYAFLGKGWLQGLYRRQFAAFGSRALVTIVHNDGLVPYAEELGIRSLVLEMAVPEPPTREGATLKHPAVVVVCGYGPDEPLPRLLAAARGLPDVQFYLSGSYPGQRRLPRNVSATGYLDRIGYWRLLNGSDVVAAFTEREATILSGAYEGLAAAKPLVLSATETLEGAFYKGAVLVENEPGAIADGIRRALDRADELSRKGAALREEKARTWERQFRALRQIVVEQ